MFKNYLTILLTAITLFFAFTTKAQDCSSLYLVNAQNGRVYDISSLSGGLPATTVTLSTAARSNLAVGPNPANTSQTVFTASNTAANSPVYVANTSIGTNVPLGVGGLTANPVSGIVYGLSGKNLVKASPAPAADLGAITGDATWNAASSTVSTDAFFDTAGKLYVILTSGSARYLYKIDIPTKIASQVVQLSGSLPSNFQGLAYFNNRIYAVEGYTTGGGFLQPPARFNAQVYEINPNTGVSVQKQSYVLNEGSSLDNLDLASCQAFVPPAAPTCSELFGLSNAQANIYRIEIPSTLGGSLNTTSIATHSSPVPSPGYDNLAYGPTVGSLDVNQFVTSRFSSTSRIYTGIGTLSDTGLTWGGASNAFTPRGTGTNPSTGIVYGLSEKSLTTWVGSGSVTSDITITGDATWSTIGLKVLNDVAVDNGGNLYAIGSTSNADVYLFRIKLNTTAAAPTTAVASVAVQFTTGIPANMFGTGAGNGPGNGMAYLGDYFYYSRRNGNTLTAVLYRVNAITGASELVGNLPTNRDFGDLASCATVTNIPAGFSFNCTDASRGVQGGSLVANGTVQNRTVRVPISGAVNGLASFTLTPTGGSASGITTAPSPYEIFIAQDATFVDIPFIYDGVGTPTAITVTSPGKTPACSIRITVLTACYDNPTTTGVESPTKHGITLLQRAGANNGGWPMIRNGGYTALESNTKGFVITRMTTAQITAISTPQEGMMVYDTDDKCLKINTTGTVPGWSCFNTPACSN